MELTLLTVPDCPNAAAFEERLATVLAGYPGAVVHRRVISDERAAAETGMHGSPTLLINGADPFAPPGQPPSLACPAVPGRGRPRRPGTVSAGPAAGAGSGRRGLKNPPRGRRHPRPRLPRGTAGTRNRPVLTWPGGEERDGHADATVRSG